MLLPCTRTNHQYMCRKFTTWMKGEKKNHLFFSTINGWNQYCTKISVISLNIKLKFHEMIISIHCNFGPMPLSLFSCHHADNVIHCGLTVPQAQWFCVQYPYYSNNLSEKISKVVQCFPWECALDCWSYVAEKLFLFLVNFIAVYMNR